MALLLIIEDEAVLARNLKRALEATGHDVRTASTGQAGLERARDELPDLVMLDLRLPDRSGLDVLRELNEAAEPPPILLMTAFASIPEAVQAMRDGATDYLQKPLDLDEVRLLIDRTLGRTQRDRELAYLRAREIGKTDGIIGQDPRLALVFEQTGRLREANLRPGERPPILLTGETGTGKGLIARTLHRILGDGPFIEINCTALPSSLVEAELFGHERGTFTDAKSARSGLIAAAEGGTLFLDEIGHLEPAIQAKFLKVIEEKRVRRLGSDSDRLVDFHIIAATNRDLDAAVGEGAFREDLLHRLRVLSFEISPLRERPGDILMLAHHFCTLFADRYGGKPRSLSAQAEQGLLKYAWPGNVRELRNVIERSFLLSSGGELHVDLAVPEKTVQAQNEPGAGTTIRLPEGGLSLEQVERDLLEQALERTQRNRTRAAALLGVSTETLRYRIRKFGID